MFMEKIDLSQWNMFSNRHNSENYNSPDGKWMLKLGFPGYCSTKEELLREQNVCRKVLSLGIRTPQVGELVEFEDRLGLIYERIVGKRSISKCVGEEPEKREHYIKIFADEARHLHSTVCAAGDFENVEERFMRLLDSSKIVRGEVATFARNLLEKTPKTMTCLQGDFQTGNIILNENGAYFIDLSEFAYGNPLYDLGCYYFFCHYVPDAFLLATHYMDSKGMRLCWDAFLKFYYQTEDPKELEALDMKVKPYVIFSVLNIEHIMAEDVERLPYLEQNYKKAITDLGF